MEKEVDRRIRFESLPLQRGECQTRTDTIPKPSEIVHKFWDEVSDYCLKYEKSTGKMPDIRNVELRILKEWEDAESK